MSHKYDYLEMHDVMMNPRPAETIPEIEEHVIADDFEQFIRDNIESAENMMAPEDFHYKLFVGAFNMGWTFHRNVTRGEHNGGGGES